MPVSDVHRQVAAVALSAAGGHGFALGGGNALLAHGRRGPQLQRPLVSLSAEDGAVLRSLLTTAIMREEATIEMYRALGARNDEGRARRLAGRSSA
jgi:hypothetical protein